MSCSLKNGIMCSVWLQEDNDVVAVQGVNDSDLKIEDVWLRPSLEGNPTELLYDIPKRRW